MNLFEAAWIFHITNIFSDEIRQIKTLDLETLAAARAYGTEIWAGVGFYKLLCLLILSCHVFWGHEDFPA